MYVVALKFHYLELILKRGVLSSRCLELKIENLVFKCNAYSVGDF